MQEAGFHPLEVIRSATMWGAEAITAPKGTKPDFGIVKAGDLADLVLVDQNPIANLKVLYGTGWIHVNDTTGANAFLFEASGTSTVTAATMSGNTFGNNAPQRSPTDNRQRAPQAAHKVK